MTGFNSASDGWMELEDSSVGAASSNQGPFQVSVPVEKRELGDKKRNDEMPEKSQRISSVCVGYGASDKLGEVPCQTEYEEDLKKLAEEHEARSDAG